MEGAKLTYSIGKILINDNNGVASEHMFITIPNEIREAVIMSNMDELCETAHAELGSMLESLIKDKIWYENYTKLLVHILSSDKSPAPPNKIQTIGVMPDNNGGLEFFTFNKLID